MAWQSRHRTLGQTPAAGAAAAARREGATLSPATCGRWHLGGEALGVRSLTPRKPQREGGPERRSVSPDVQPPGQRGGHSRPRPPRSPPTPTLAESEPKAKGAASPAWRPLGGRRALPSPRGHHFVTSLVSQQARATRAPPTLASSSAARSLLRSPRFPSLPAGPGRPPRSRSLASHRPWPSARWPPPGGRHVAAPAPRSSPAPSPAELSALPAARCRAS